MTNVTSATQHNRNTTLRPDDSNATCVRLRSFSGDAFECSYFVFDYSVSYVSYATAVGQNGEEKIMLYMLQYHKIILFLK